MRFLKTNLRRNFYKLAKKCNYISSELNYRYLNTLNYLSYKSVYLTNYEDEIEKAQYSLLRQNPTANCVGFYGANCKSKEEHFKKFTLELTTRNYSLFNFTLPNPDSRVALIYAILLHVLSCNAAHRKDSVAMNRNAGTYHRLGSNPCTVFNM